MKNSIFAVNIENFAGHFKDGLSLVEPAIQQDILRFRQEKDRHRKLISSLLLRFFVRNFLNLSKYCVSKNKFGKPYLQDYPDFHFNLSHSGNWVIGAVSDTPLGVDVEKVSTFHDYMGIAKRFYSEKEYSFLLGHDEKSRIEIFYDIWTKKESLIKAVGDGLSIPLKSFNVPLNADGMIKYNEVEWNVSTPAFNDEHYKLAICFSSNEAVTVKYIIVNELVKI